MDDQEPFGTKKRMEHLVLFKEGNDFGKRSRQRKFVGKLKQHGYKAHEINDCILVLLSMTAAELNDVLTEPKATVLEMLVARALLKATLQGDLSPLEPLLNRVFGKPKETVELISPEIVAARRLFEHLREEKGLTREDAVKVVIDGAAKYGFVLTEADFVIENG
jgi:hypothetical protein